MLFEPNSNPNCEVQLQEVDPSNDTITNLMTNLKVA